MFAVKAVAAPRPSSISQIYWFLFSGGSFVSGMRQNLRPEVKSKGPPGVFALRQEVSLHLLRQNFHQSKLHESAHQENSPRKSSTLLKTIFKIFIAGSLKKTSYDRLREFSSKEFVNLGKQVLKS
jgi:hypothetical protein